VPMFWMERRWGSKDKETQTLHVGLLVDLIGQQGQRNAKAACGATGGFDRATRTKKRKSCMWGYRWI